MTEDFSIFNKSEPSEHKCIFAVDEKKNILLLKSKPSLYDLELIDDNDLGSIITKYRDDLPSGLGIYTGTIMVSSYFYSTDCGTEYDMDIWIESMSILKLLKL